METYLENNQYIKTVYKDKKLESWVYPYTVIHKETDLVSIDFAKGKLVASEKAKKTQELEFHRASLFKLALMNSLE
jgi:hypothetical protein